MLQFVQEYKSLMRDIKTLIKVEIRNHINLVESELKKKIQGHSGILLKLWK